MKEYPCEPDRPTERYEGRMSRKERIQKEAAFVCMTGVCVLIAVLLRDISLGEALAAWILVHAGFRAAIWGLQH